MVNRYMYLAFAQSVILPLAWVVVWYDLDTSAMSESAFMTFVVSLQLRTVENRVDRVVCMLVLVVLKTSPSWASPAPPWLPHVIEGGRDGNSVQVCDAHATATH